VRPRDEGCPNSEITVRYGKISVMMAVMRPFALAFRSPFPFVVNRYTSHYSMKAIVVRWS
jgi:hypothetical protein